MEIRPITAADIDPVVDVIHRSVTISNAPDYHPDVIAHQVSIFTADLVRHRMDRLYMIVAVLDGKIVGTGSFHQGEMRTVYVDPDFERKGIGRAIMAKLEQYAIYKNYPHTHLGSSKTAIGFYKSLGYTLDEEVEFVVRRSYLDRVPDEQISPVGANHNPIMVGLHEFLV